MSVFYIEKEDEEDGKVADNLSGNLNLDKGMQPTKTDGLLDLGFKPKCTKIDPKVINKKESD